MESLVLFHICVVVIIAGIRLLIRARRPAGGRSAMAGAIFLLVGAILLISGFWSMGTLVGGDDAAFQRAIGVPTLGVPTL